MIDRYHLTIIHEVDRLGTLTKAASKLHLTQPALTHAIRKLETQLGTKLWRKEGRRLRLTQAGQYLANLANRLLPQLEQADSHLRDYAQGQRGALRIGMECHPCYQWLLKVVTPYLQAWPDVDVDVKQKFQFGGIGALFGHEIDLLITPDPLDRPGLRFTPVFDYELVLAVAMNHPLAGEQHITPEQLSGEVLLSYPVPLERLDIYNQFLIPANCTPRRHKEFETTDIMLHMVSAGRGVAAMPNWLIAEYSRQIPLKEVRIGRSGIRKQIFIGCRQPDLDTAYLNSFIEMAKQLSH